MYVRREALMMALIKEQRKHIDSGEEVKCYLEFLLSLEKQLTEKQIMILLWEIAINVYACSMDKRVWEDPEEWKPERFLKKENDTMDLNKTMAFGGGKRVCAGSLETLFISCVTIGRLIQEFEWRLKDGEEDNVHTLGLTTKKLHPMRAIIKPRI
ncbi:hypothetical protein LguiA_003769 [Lonicera macranthoides]